MEIKTQFVIHQRVKISDLERVGRIVAFWTDGNTQQIKVRFWLEGKLEEIYFFEDELKAT